MPSPSPEFLFEDAFDTEDWFESVKPGEIRSGTLSREKSSNSLTIVCDFDKHRAAKRYILGYSYVDEGLVLRRVLPAWHPEDNWLWARSLSEKFDGMKFVDTDISEWENANEYSTWNYANITIEFGEFPWEFWEDDEVTYEYERYVEKVAAEPVRELIAVEGGQLLAHCPGIGAPLNGTTITAAKIFVPRVITTHTWIWREVPLDYVEDDDGGFPKLEAIVMRTNSVAWLGCEIGEVLCEKAKPINRRPAPIMTDIFSEPQYMVDVEFTFKVFKPSRGDTTIAKYGWNLQPRPVVTGATAVTAVAWIYHTHDGTLTGKPLYEGADFATAFEHWND